ncbi:hypothetical protein [Halobaculum roseum]|uniref:Uncharacterized protein n=1 Tax=Halobaculum roseum TaxID=2175149 RepID=A0ABD5MP55_9EURY|nr:hypothetical protein [Halobaculum roseum]QZY01990.1 hypothetical protein K6T36_11815 [Halobaculum roseum]
MVAQNASSPTQRARSSTLGGLVIVLASIALSIASYGPLANTVRIRWMVGTYYQYGPEHASTVFVLVAFPVVVAGASIGAHWLGDHLERAVGSEGSDGFRTLYDVCVLVTLGIVVAVQALVIVLNL